MTELLALLVILLFFSLLGAAAMGWGVDSSASSNDPAASIGPPRDHLTNSFFPRADPLGANKSARGAQAAG